jgi:HemY protein
LRAVFAFLLLAAAAIALALFARYNAGYVLFVAPPYRLEVSLNAFVVLAFGAFFLLHLLLRFASRLAALPAEVRESRKRQQAERARNRQDAALVALLEGRYVKAREFAEEALAIPGSGGIPALIASRAATEMHEFDVAKELLARADVGVPSLAVPRMMLQAEVALAQGRGTDALAILGELKREAGSHTAALRLEMRTLAAAGHHAEVPPIVDQLVKRKVYDAAQGEMLRASAHAKALTALASDPAGLREYWNRLPDADRFHPKVARAAAKSLLALGADRDAAEAIARCLERHWDSDLVELYAECRTPNPTPQLEAAERWLLTHSQDPALLRALGRLCERAQLWGKAQTYLEASIALEDNWASRVALGEMLARLGRHDEANAHLAEALKLALAALGRASPSR